MPLSKPDPEADPSMFQKVTPYDFQKYKGPLLSFSRRFDDQHPLLVSFPRADKIDLSALSSAKLTKRLLPDPDRIWSNYQVYQAYSLGETSQKFRLKNFPSPSALSNKTRSRPPLPSGKGGSVTKVLWFSPVILTINSGVS